MNQGKYTARCAYFYFSYRNNNNSSFSTHGNAKGYLSWAFEVWNNYVFGNWKARLN